MPGVPGAGEGPPIPLPDRKPFNFINPDRVQQLQVQVSGFNELKTPLEKAGVVEAVRDHISNLAVNAVITEHAINYPRTGDTRGISPARVSHYLEDPEIIQKAFKDLGISEESELAKSATFIRRDNYIADLDNLSSEDVLEVQARIRHNRDRHCWYAKSMLKLFLWGEVPINGQVRAVPIEVSADKGRDQETFSRSKNLQLQGSSAEVIARKEKVHRAYAQLVDAYDRNVLGELNPDDQNEQTKVANRWSAAQFSGIDPIQIVHEDLQRHLFAPLKEPVSTPDFFAFPDSYQGRKTAVSFWRAATVNYLLHAEQFKNPSTDYQTLLKNIESGQIRDAFGRMRKFKTTDGGHTYSPDTFDKEKTTLAAVVQTEMLEAVKEANPARSEALAVILLEYHTDNFAANGPTIKQAVDIVTDRVTTSAAQAEKYSDLVEDYIVHHTTEKGHAVRQILARKTIAAFTDAEDPQVRRKLASLAYHHQRDDLYASNGAGPLLTEAFKQRINEQIEKGRNADKSGAENAFNSRQRLQTDLHNAQNGEQHFSELLVSQLRDRYTITNSQWEKDLIADTLIATIGSQADSMQRIIRERNQSHFSQIRATLNEFITQPKIIVADQHLEATKFTTKEFTQISDAATRDRLQKAASVLIDGIEQESKEQPDVAYQLLQNFSHGFLSGVAFTQEAHTASEIKNFLQGVAKQNGEYQREAVTSGLLVGYLVKENSLAAFAQVLAAGNLSQPVRNSLQTTLWHMWETATEPSYKLQIAKILAVTPDLRSPVSDAQERKFTEWLQSMHKLNETELRQQVYQNFVEQTEITIARTAAEKLMIIHIEGISTSYAMENFVNQWLDLSKPTEHSEVLNKTKEMIREMVLTQMVTNMAVTEMNAQEKQFVKGDIPLAQVLSTIADLEQRFANPGHETNGIFTFTYYDGQSLATSDKLKHPPQNPSLADKVQYQACFIRDLLNGNLAPRNNAQYVVDHYRRQKIESMHTYFSEANKWGVSTENLAVLYNQALLFANNAHQSITELDTKGAHAYLYMSANQPMNLRQRDDLVNTVKKHSAELFGTVITEVSNLRQLVQLTENAETFAQVKQSPGRVKQASKSWTALGRLSNLKDSSSRNGLTLHNTSVPQEYLSQLRNNLEAFRSAREALNLLGALFGKPTRKVTHGISRTKTTALTIKDSEQGSFNQLIRDISRITGEAFDIKKIFINVK